MISVWMTKDPETERIALQTREFGEGDFPPGKRGRGWEIRHGSLSAEDWTSLLTNTMTQADQDLLHETLWAAGEKIPA